MSQESRELLDTIMLLFERMSIEGQRKLAYLAEGVAMATEENMDRPA